MSDKPRTLKDLIGDPMKPREFWVSEHGSTWIDWDGPPNVVKDFYLSGGKTWHVIEKSAYDRLEAMCGALKKELDELKNARIQTNTETL